jgi:Domain of unknown function (DUF5666)
MNISTKKIAAIASGLALSALVALPTFAQVTNPSQGNGGWQSHGGPGGPRQGQGGAGMHGGMGMMGMAGHGIFGSVTAINGTSLTVTGQQGFASSTTAVVYTVDASNAMIRKGQATTTVSSIAIGDKVMVQGTVSGTSVTAQTIIDGFAGQGTHGPVGGRVRPGSASSTAPFVGNGQPVVAGSVSAISGTSLTVTTAAGATYTVDASNAKIVHGSATVAVSDVSVGDKVIIQGTVNGSSITAATVIDQGAQAAASGAGQNGQGQNPPAQHGGGFLGGIGNFFKRIFGF